MKIKTLFLDIFHLFYPRTCVVCERSLVDRERYICLECLLHLPINRNYLHPANEIFNLSNEKISLCQAASYMEYNKEGMGQKIVHAIKYKGDVWLGYYIGTRMAKDISISGFFEDIDYLVPIPLHPLKLKERGFNQSEIIAKGISAVTQIPVETKTLRRLKNNSSQTKKSISERWSNTTDLFSLKNKHFFEGKHVLIIDDVFTSGATLFACAKCFFDIPNVKISILTLAIA